jgi:membrane dipeptidase
MSLARALSLAALSLILFQPGAAVAADSVKVSKAARSVHERAIVLDTHIDTPVHFGRPGWDIMDRHTHQTDGSQIDFPRMVDAGLDGGFWVVFTEQGPVTPEGFADARDFGLRRLLQIREMVARHSKSFELALEPADAQRIAGSGKRIVFISMENSYPIGDDLTLMRTFYDLGLRLAGPIHFKNNQFGDSSTDETKWGGLSPLGREYVAQANRLGILLDASHASDDTLRQMIDLSKTPVLLSHSGLKSINDHPRGIDDDLLRKLAASGGVIQLYAVDFFMAPADWRGLIAAWGKLEGKYGDIAKTPANGAAEMIAEQYEIAAQFPPHADFETFMSQLLHAIDVAGVDHVGLGADWDGGAGLEGFDKIEDLPKVTERLLQAGYSEAEINKILGGNVLRLLGQAEAYARSQQ